jgi:putative transposase
VKYQFIAAHRSEFQVRLMGGVLEVSRSGYYAWLKRPLSPREMANQVLSQQIKQIHQHSRQTYGSPRIQAELRAQGFKCGHNRVARLMREQKLWAKQKRKFKVTTTDSVHPYPVAPNLLDQDFTASRPNEKWLTDITYIPTAEGWLYLAAVLDLPKVPPDRRLGYERQFGTSLGYLGPANGRSKAPAGAWSAASLRSGQPVCQRRLSSLVDPLSDGL